MTKLDLQDRKYQALDHVFQCKPKTFARMALICQIKLFQLGQLTIISAADTTLLQQRKTE